MWEAQRQQTDAVSVFTLRSDHAYAAQHYGAYNKNVARGWESKSVESQIESAESSRAPLANEKLTSERSELLRKKETLLLSRTRVLNDMHSCTHERYRVILENALAHLENQLAELEENRVATAPKTATAVG